MYELSCVSIKYKVLIYVPLRADPLRLRFDVTRLSRRLSPLLDDDDELELDEDDELDELERDPDEELLSDELECKYKILHIFIDIIIISFHLPSTAA